MTGVLGLSAGVVGTVRAGIAARGAGDATKIANEALTKSAVQAQRAADELAEANRLFELATSAQPWAVQFSDRTHFQLVNMTGRIATDVVTTEVGGGTAGGFGMDLETNGANRAEPGRGINFAWYLGATSPRVLAVLVKWNSGVESVPIETIIYVDRRPDAAAIERFESALAEVMAALQRRHSQLDRWIREATPLTHREPRGQRMVEPSEQIRGPSDSDLQTAVDIAVMRSTVGTKGVMDALLTCTFALKQGRVGWQGAVTGEIAGDIRKWRTEELTSEQFIDEMTRLQRQAKEQNQAFIEMYPNL